MSQIPQSETQERPGPAPTRRDRKRILFVVNSLAGGGAERVFSTILAKSPERLAEHDVHVALLDQDPAAFDLPSQVCVHQLDCRHGLVRSIASLTRLARSLQPDLLVSFLTRSNVAATLAARAIVRPVVISERNDTSAQLSHSRMPPLARMIVRWTYGRADHLIAVSDGVAAALHAEFGVDSRRVSVINNPVDIHAVREAATTEPPFKVAPNDVVMLARLEPQKNLQLAIRSFAKAGHPGRLLILGDGSQRAELLALGEAVGLGPRLVLPGYVRNPYPIVGRASLLMLTSRHEGFCNALVESMALGVPVLASDCRFSPAEILQASKPRHPGEVVVGTGGLLVAVDDEDAVASGLQAILRDSNLATRLGEQARERVRDFESGPQIDQYWRLIARFLDGPDRRPMHPNASQANDSD